MVAHRGRPRLSDKAGTWSVRGSPLLPVCPAQLCVVGQGSYLLRASVSGLLGVDGNTYLQWGPGFRGLWRWEGFMQWWGVGEGSQQGCFQPWRS